MLRLTRRLRRSAATASAPSLDENRESQPDQHTNGSTVRQQSRRLAGEETRGSQPQQKPPDEATRGATPSGRGTASARRRPTDEKRARAPPPPRENGDSAGKSAHHLGVVDSRPWHQRTFESVDLNCSICLEKFNRPITLPCWHSFCLLCLQNFLKEYQRTFSCPQCRREVQVPAGGLRDFRCNPRLREALDSHEKRGAVLVRRSAARLCSDESSSSCKDSNNGEDPGPDEAELRDLLLTGVSLLRSEALEKLEIVRDVGKSIEDQIEAEYKLRLEVLEKLKDHARLKCLSAVTIVESTIENLNKTLDDALSSNVIGIQGQINGSSAERSQASFSKVLSDLRRELDVIDVSTFISFDARSFRVTIDSSAARNTRDPHRRGQVVQTEGSSTPRDSRSVSPAVQMRVREGIEERGTTEARSSNIPRMGTSVLNRNQSNHASRISTLQVKANGDTTVRQKRPLSRTKALSGSEDLSAFGFTPAQTRAAPGAVASANISSASSLASLNSASSLFSPPSLRRVSSNVSDNSRLSGRGATANLSGSLSVRSKPRRPAVFDTNRETDLIYKTTNFSTRIVVTSHQLVRPSGLVICPWIVNANGRITPTPVGNRQPNATDSPEASENGTQADFAFLVVSADLHRVCVCSLESGGTIAVSKLFGRRGDAPGEFLHPVGIAVDRKRREIYVTDNWQHCVHVFATNGKFLRRWGLRGTAPGYFTSPGGIAIDDERRDGPVVYVCDCGNNRVQILDRDGVFIGFLDGDPFSGVPEAKKSPAIGRTADGGSEGQQQQQRIARGFDEPISVAVDYKSGNVVVADSGNDRIKVYQTKDLKKPVLTSVFGSSGRWTGMFKKPDCVAIDADGYIFVAENGTRRVQIFTQEGEFLAQLAAGDFRWAGGIAVTSDRKILIADYERNRVRIVY